MAETNQKCRFWPSCEIHRGEKRDRSRAEYRRAVRGEREAVDWPDDPRR